MAGNRKKIDDYSCGFILFKKVEERILYLLLRHHKGGHWGTPKGHPEGGESLKEAALRETAEECCLTPSRIVENFQVSEIYDVRKGTVAVHKKVSYFLGEVPADAVAYLSYEHTEALWLSLDRARGLAFDELGNVLTQVEEHIATLKS
jgi:bis(5'-nucleosidyl)-tetraphosphatase